ncbi:hypothetical protein Patl1_02761 [Pistacia atlantica]|uniref:Uncharacterized protein n=1 Tax=Pistacia atlantica TaxID=434234 RepID=A0ACC1C788_9ROSI|nr:hypothetical protein Patl1_02761 [Pistacia atlantica]
MERAEKTKIMFAVTESKRHGYPHPSAISRRAVFWTLEKIVRYNTSGFHLSFIHVHSPAATCTQLEKNNSNGDALLQYFINRCNSLEIDSEAINRAGLNVSKIICKEAKRKNADLLVVGGIARQRTGLDLWKRIFSAEVIEHCVGHAKCPVLTYRRSEDDNNEDEIDYDRVAGGQRQD